MRIVRSMFEHIYAIDADCIIRTILYKNPNKPISVIGSSLLYTPHTVLSKDEFEEFILSQL